MDEISSYIKMEALYDVIYLHNIHGYVIYISYYADVLSLKIVFIAETRCLWLLIDDVSILDWRLFYLVIYLNTTGMFGPKIQGGSVDPEYHLMWRL